MFRLFIGFANRTNRVGRISLFSKAIVHSIYTYIRLGCCRITGPPLFFLSLLFTHSLSVCLSWARTSSVRVFKRYASTASLRIEQNWHRANGVYTHTHARDVFIKIVCVLCDSVQLIHNYFALTPHGHVKCFDGCQVGGSTFTCIINIENLTIHSSI